MPLSVGSSLTVAFEYNPKIIAAPPPPRHIMDLNCTRTANQNSNQHTFILKNLLVIVHKIGERGAEKMTPKLEVHRTAVVFPASTFGGSRLPVTLASGHLIPPPGLQKGPHVCIQK